MPYILLDLSSQVGAPLGNSNKFSISLSFGPIGIANVRIESYQVFGLPSIQPLFLKLTNQPTSIINTNGNSSNSFPLFFDNFPNTAVFLHKPIHITQGDNLWNSNVRLEIELLDRFGNNAIFSQLLVWLAYDEPVHEFTDHAPDHIGVKTREHTEVMARHQAPLPSSFGSFLNSMVKQTFGDDNRDLFDY